MRALLIAVAATVVLAFAVDASAACTTPDPGAGFVCVNGQWLPPGHPLIPVAQPPAPEAGAPDCDPIPNPYVEQERAAACSAWDAEHRPTPTLPTFEVGSVYRDGYDNFRIAVLAVSRSLEGVPVVTAQRIKPADGFVFSFRVDQGVPWNKVPQ